MTCSDSSPRFVYMHEKKIHLFFIYYSAAASSSSAYRANYTCSETTWLGKSNVCEGWSSHQAAFLEDIPFKGSRDLAQKKIRIRAASYLSCDWTVPHPFQIKEILRSVRETFAQTHTHSLETVFVDRLWDLYFLPLQFFIIVHKILMKFRAHCHLNCLPQKQSTHMSESLYATICYSC